MNLRPAILVAVLLAVTLTHGSVVNDFLDAGAFTHFPARFHSIRTN